MTPERFRELADAHGGDLRRWPAVERAAAQRLTDADDDGALRQVLADAAQLDALLAAHVVEPPGAALVRRIVAGAPARRVRWRAVQLWWSGAGLAGVGLAGALAGAVAMSALSPALVAPSATSTIDRLYAATAFGGGPADWSDE